MPSDPRPQQAPLVVASVAVAIAAAAAAIPGPVAHAAPCCAGGGSLPAMITGDEASQLTLTTSAGTVIGDAPAEGIPVFRSSRVRETSQLLKLDAATVFSGAFDRWQAGVSVPMLRHDYWRATSGSNSAMAPGDVQLGTAFEFLPEWSYSEWKPKGFVFAQLTLPTGRSIYESTATDAVDVTGKGFTTASAGVILVKRWSVWDASLSAQVSHSMGRDFAALPGGEPLSVAPFWGASAGASVGWSRGAFRAGLRLQPTYVQALTTTAPSSVSVSSCKLTWDTGLDLTWLVHDDWSLSGAYVDQTLLGPAVNASLSRTVAVTLLHRWPR